MGAGDDHLLLHALSRDRPLNGPDPNQSVFDEGPDRPWKTSWGSLASSSFLVLNAAEQKADGNGGCCWIIRSLLIKHQLGAASGVEMQHQRERNI